VVWGLKPLLDHYGLWVICDLTSFLCSVKKEFNVHVNTGK